MALTYKRLFAGLGTPFIPTLAYTVPGSTQDVVGQITVTNAPSDGNPAYLGSHSQGVVDVVPNPVTGDLYVLYKTCIYKVSYDGKVRLFAGHPLTAGTTDGTGLAARFNLIAAGVIDPAGTNMYVYDESTGGVVRQIVLSTGVVTIRAGQFATNTETDNTTGTSGTIISGGNVGNGTNMAIKADGSVLYLAVNNNSSKIRTVTLSGNYALGSITWTGTTGSVFGVQVSTDQNYLYVWVRNSHIVRIPIAGGATTTLFSGSAQAASHGSGAVQIIPSLNIGPRFWIDDSRAPKSYRLYYADHQNARIAVTSVTSADETGTSYNTSQQMQHALTGSSVGDLRTSGLTITAGDTAGYPGTARINYPVSLKQVGNSFIVLLSSASGGGTSNTTIGRVGIDDGFYHRVAGFIPTQVTAAAFFQMEGAALTDTSGYFNVYVVPNGETLDRTKHCRFRNQAVSVGETWEAQLKTSLGAGDKIYIEPLSMQLNFEISAVEVA